MQRMQLQMTAPLDIGLEQHDAALGAGQEDVFDLGETEKRMSRKAQVQWFNDEILETVDEEESDVIIESARSGDDVLSSDEERDRKIEGLEAELDDLYDAYKDRLRERDAKFKAREERAKDKEREKEWNGIQTADDVDEESDDSGGWDVAQRNKLRDDTSSDESSNDGSEDGNKDEDSSAKRKRSSKDVIALAAKRQRLVRALELPSKPLTTATRLWFSQGVFSGLDVAGDLNLDEETQEEEIDKDESVTEEEVPAEGDQEVEEVRLHIVKSFIPSLTQHQLPGTDFEVVHQSKDDDIDMWDANDDRHAAEAEKNQRK